jgi:hypothetical protein
MTATHKPFALVYDAETTRPGERPLAGPLEAHYAHRALLIREADGLWLRLMRAQSDAAEAAHFLRVVMDEQARAQDEARQSARLIGARDAARRRYPRRLFGGTGGSQARARGEASDG